MTGVPDPDSATADTPSQDAHSDAAHSDAAHSDAAHSDAAHSDAVHSDVADPDTGAHRTAHTDAAADTAPRRTTRQATCQEGTPVTHDAPRSPASEDSTTSPATTSVAASANSAVTTPTHVSVVASGDVYVGAGAPSADTANGAGGDARAVRTASDDQPAADAGPLLPGPLGARVLGIHDTPARVLHAVPAVSPTAVPAAVPDASASAMRTSPDPTSGASAGTSPVEKVQPSAVSVWTTAQTSPATQRKGRYVPASTAHPAKMLPEVVRHAVAHYTRPGDLVLDPMCGIGTTLVEAVRMGRRAIGIEYEPHWVDVARQNLDLAREHGVAHDAGVVHGDARQLAALLPPAYLGQVALVVTSPPYGPSTHGQVAVAPGEGIQKYHHRYGNTLDRGNLANIGHHRLLSGFTRILAALRPFLAPGGRIAITIRPWREHSELIDLPAQVLACGRAAGLVAVERNVALLARAADTELVARGSFFQRDFIRKQREAGLPLHLIAHEDLLVFALTADATGDTRAVHGVVHGAAPSTPPTVDPPVSLRGLRAGTTSPNSSPREDPAVDGDTNPGVGPVPGWAA